MGAAVGAAGSSSGAADGGENKGSTATIALTEEELVARVDKALALIATAEKLAPYDPQQFNAALLVWRTLAAIPAAHRHRLLDGLSSSDIRRLWRLSVTRYAASKQEVSNTTGGHAVWDDMPDEPGQVALFQGKAALPLHTLGVSRFSKAFFVGPRDYELYGRVLLGRGPLGDALYPLYYKASVKRSTIEATGEVAELALEYLQPKQLLLAKDDMPVRSWPAPGKQRYPFSGGLTDYLRPVGPGVYVGVGWKAARPGIDLGRRFLYFVMVRQHS